MYMYYTSIELECEEIFRLLLVGEEFVSIALPRDSIPHHSHQNDPTIGTTILQIYSFKRIGA